MLSAKYSDDGDNNYIEAAVDFEIAKDLSLALHYGSYSFDVSAGDYSDYSIALNKGDWSFMLSDTDAPMDDYRLMVAYSISVDLLK